jgi:lipopolysaccharide biosynthesis glycosyltransferase
MVKLLQRYVSYIMKYDKIILIDVDLLFIARKLLRRDINSIKIYFTLYRSSH